MAESNEVYTTTIKQYLNEGGYLPEPLKDFQDQKQFFKYLHEKHCIDDDLLICNGKEMCWKDGHIYTVDYFLHFMAKFGYKLQRDRTNIEFRDIREELETFRTSQTEEFRKAVDS